MICDNWKNISKFNMYTYMYNRVINDLQTYIRIKLFRRNGIEIPIRGEKEMM